MITYVNQWRDTG